MSNKAIVLLALFLTSGAAHAGETYTATAPRPASSPAPTENKKLTCQEKWNKYQESQACFAPYRLAHGGIKAEAYKHCKEVKQPEFCN